MQRLRFGLWRLRDAIRDRIHGKTHRERVFSRIVAENRWGDSHSVSGAGSNMRATENIRRDLPTLFRRYKVRSLLDAPCGDFAWMNRLVGELDRYVGVDIVPDLIKKNTTDYGGGNVSFVCADIAIDALATSDMVLCRDCFIHLPTRLIRATLANFRAAQIPYLLVTNDRITEPYHDIPIGSFRKINFLQPPFSFPEPLEAINEEDTGTRQLCLWDLRTLPIA